MGWWQRLFGRKPAPAAPTGREHFDRGVTFLREGDMPMAIQAFTQALEVDPTLIDAWSNRGVARERLGDVEGAKADYAKSIEIQFRNALKKEITE